MDVRRRWVQEERLGQMRGKMRQDGKVRGAKIGGTKEREVKWLCQERKEQCDGRVGKEKGKCRMEAEDCEA